MFIVINCLGLPFNGNTIKERSLGGSETAAYYMAKELAKKGHRVTIFTNSQQEGEFDGVKYIHAGEINERTPLGSRFHTYAQNTPHDVLIVQRHPQAFLHNFQAKIKLWWLHDLALIRNAENIRRMLWNVTGILTVSEFHKKQVCDAWGVNPSIVHAITNGIDLSLFEGDIKETNQLGVLTSNYTVDSVKLLYTSRPERGLEHLVMGDGIMERLWQKDEDYHLYVCSYDYTTGPMEEYYRYLHSRCEDLPNVTVLGHLTKQELADVMRQCHCLVYPTPSPLTPVFQEVSCITAMETMAAGLPMIASMEGALPETCKDSGVELLKPNDNGLPSINLFTGTIRQKIRPGTREYEKIVEKQLAAAKKYSWENAAKSVLSIIIKTFDKRKTNFSIGRHLIRQGDIYSLVKMEIPQNKDICRHVDNELKECYDFALNDTPYFAKHYREYYEYEKERGVNYGPEDLSGNHRFEFVSNRVGKSVPDGGTVLDYGCAHGHYTIHLAKRFPDKKFIGIDIAESNVKKAKAWAKKEGLTNIEFHHDYLADGKLSVESWVTRRVDCIIAAEVLEHVEDPWNYIDTLEQYLKKDGHFIITTPFGPWEATSSEEHWPWRAHVHHFEREDIHDVWGHKPNFNIVCIPSSPSRWDDMLGSYVTMFSKSDVKSGRINIHRKRHQCVPKQTMSLCMIVKDAEATLKQSIDSLIDVVDEIIIAVDETTTDRTWDVIDNMRKSRKGIFPVIKSISIPSPLETGFDDARNASVAKASCDWIFWLDSDEVVVNPTNLHKYMQNNGFDSYAIPQHHFSIEPLGVLKTDLPARMFRNGLGMKFFGRVHEHPEIKFNEGPGHASVVNDVHVAHNGYTTEDIRKQRFSRNIGLMQRDRKDYPDRILGKFLWVRDISMLVQFTLEAGGIITNEMKASCQDAMDCWESLLDKEHIGRVLDSLEYYSVLSRVLGEGFDMQFKADFSKYSNGVNADRNKTVTAHFLKAEHARKLLLMIFEGSTKDFDSRYY